MRTLLILLVVGFTSFNAIAQTDTLPPPYKQIPELPAFKIILADSTWYLKSNLDRNKPVLILYFSPDCGHCQMETEDIISKIGNLKNLQIIMITSKPYKDMLDFSNYYKLYRFKNIKVGTDPNRFITRFYAVKSTPFSALYSKKGKLIKAYEKGVDFNDLYQVAQ